MFSKLHMVSRFSRFRSSRFRDGLADSDSTDSLSRFSRFTELIQIQGSATWIVIFIILVHTMNSYNLKSFQVSLSIQVLDSFEILNSLT